MQNQKSFTKSHINLCRPTKYAEVSNSGLKFNTYFTQSLSNVKLDPLLKTGLVICDCQFQKCFIYYLCNKLLLILLDSQQHNQPLTTS